MELSVSKLWRAGPEWLTSDLIPLDIESIPMPELCMPELRTNSKLSHNLLAIEKGPDIREVISCANYSSHPRLLRVTAYILGAVNSFRARETSDSNLPVILTPQEIAIAEKLWIANAQMDLVLQKDFNTLKTQFGLFLDDKGLWRCGGRLQNAGIPFTAKHPLLLPREYPFTSLVICDAHHRVGHNGVKETLTEVRRKYWIVRGRSLIRALIHRCTTCREHEGAPFNGPPPPPLPEFRIKEDPAFTYTGVDFAGPLFVHNRTLNGGSKVWICLFTYLVT